MYTGLIGVTSDSHGEFETLDNRLNSVPEGTALYFLGDMYGPKKPNLMNKIKGISGDYFENLDSFAGKSEENKALMQEYVDKATAHTEGVIDAIKKHSETKPLEAILRGNGELYHDLLWEGYGGDKESPDKMFMNSGLNYPTLPVVHFYKDGKKVDNEKNVDAAVLVLPYMLNDYLIKKISKFKDVKIKDTEDDAIKEIPNLVKKIRDANPKFIFQLQHENPKAELFYPFGIPYEPDNKRLYEIVMEELGKIVEDSKGSIYYKLIFAHIDKGGRFGQLIYHKGREIEAIHLDDTNIEVLLIDTKTGRVYEKGEIPIDIRDKIYARGEKEEAGESKTSEEETQEEGEAGESEGESGEGE